MTVAASPAGEPRRRSRRLRTVRRFFRHPGATGAVIVLALLATGAIFAPLIAPYDFVATDMLARLKPPSAEHLFGTDLHGRDIFSRMLFGARYSLAVGFATVALALVVGASVGILIGYTGGRVDEWGSRFLDVLLGFPAIVMAILVVAVLGVGLVNVVIAVAISHMPRFARVVRGAVLVTKEQLYVESAQALGASRLRIMARHVFPNIVPTLIVLGTLDLGNAILGTATLSFLGLGAQPPTPEWGAMLNSGREYMRYAPWLMLFPGLALFITVMAVNLLGDRLAQVLDPRAKDRA